MVDLNKLKNIVLDLLPPEEKEQYYKDIKWREEKYKNYCDLGHGEKDAQILAWNDFWKMVRERDGVEISICKLNR